MSSSDNEIVLVCLAVQDDRTPGDPSSTKGHYCMECACEVWMSKRARDFWKDNPKARIVCAPCSIELAEDDNEFEVRALPGDRLGEAIAKQMPDIIRRAYGRPPQP